MRTRGLDSSHLGQGSVVGYCEQGYEPQGIAWRAHQHLAVSFSRITQPCGVNTTRKSVVVSFLHVLLPFPTLN
jgi:hypothetical protein